MNKIQKQVKDMHKTEKRNRKEVNEKNNKVVSNSQKNKGQGHILLIGVLVIMAGILIVLASIILSTAYIPTISEDEILRLKMWDVVDALLMCLGTTVITIGAGTALYSYFDFVNYMQDKMKKVMLDYDFTDILSDPEKKRLATKLEKEIVQQTDGSDLYDFVQDEVLSLTKQVFYENYELNIACEKDGGTIRKIIKKSYVMNCNPQPDFDIAAANHFSICHKNDNTDIAKNISLKINNITFSKGDFSTQDEPSNDEVYNKKVIYRLKDVAKEKIQTISHNVEWDGIYRVENGMISEVSDDDMTFSYRLYYPCRRTRIIFTYNPCEFEVMENIFVFKDTDLSNSVDNPVKVTRNKGSIVIDINNWILPGDGIVFFLAPAKNTTQNAQK